MIPNVTPPPPSPGSLRRHLAYIRRQLPESLVLVISRLGLRRVRLLQILIKKDAKSGHRRVSFTTSHAGIHRPRLWRLFPFPILTGKIIPASNHPQFFYRGNPLGIRSCQSERQLFTETEIDEMAPPRPEIFFTSSPAQSLP